MTPEQEAIIAALRDSVAAGEPISMMGMLLLAVAEDRERWRLRSVWQEARSEELLATDGVDDVVANEGPGAVVRQAIAWAEACARKT